MESLPTDDRAWFDAVLGNQPQMWRLMVEACGGTVIAEDDVQAAVLPGSPNRSFFNSVFYSDTDRLIERLPRLAELYDEAGVNAWTVWIPASDERAREALAAAGHLLDATPRAMGIELSELRLPEPDPELEVREEEPGEENMELLRKINEVAYGYPPGDFVPMVPLPGSLVYLAELGGETVAAGLIVDFGLDAEATLIATLPEARGRGVAKRLLGQALERARERGKRASTLISTKLGYPVYLGLGYREVGGLEMWERRRA